MKIWIKKTKNAKYAKIVMIVIISICQQDIFNALKSAISQQISLKIRRKNS